MSFCFNLTTWKTDRAGKNKELNKMTIDKSKGLLRAAILVTD